MNLAIKICLWALAFVPLVVDPNVFFPYASSKTLFIESTIILSGILFMINLSFSSRFRGEIIHKAVCLIKNPMVLSLLSFFGIFIISTLGAVDRNRAFWGTLERGEGLAGTAFFLVFFLLSYLVFDRKDWFYFFKLSLFTSLILLSKELVSAFSGSVRPGSFSGNPTFLAGFLLFSFGFSLLVIGDSKNKFWRYLSFLVLVLSVIGIFITQTRGTILGLFLGLVSILIYCVFKGGGFYYKKINLSKFSLALLCLLLVFSGAFLVTRKSVVWQKLPGISRLADTNIAAGTVATRLLIYKSALVSINPLDVGWRKFLIGWGPDNFVLVDNKYYDSDIFKIENTVHDRSHNKFIDVLVMNGVLGLIFYLIVWFYFFTYILKRKESFFIKLGLLFLGISFLTHISFIFDDISTFIVYFSLLSFVASLPLPQDSILKTADREKKLLYLGTEKQYGFIVLTLLPLTFLCFVFFKNTLPGYFQMRDYTSFMKNLSPVNAGQDHHFIFSPMTTAQVHIRRNFLDTMSNYSNTETKFFNADLLNEAMARGEEYVSSHPLDFSFMTTLADFYNKKLNFSRSEENLKKAEGYFRKILDFSPNRPDINRSLAINLVYQKRLDEAFLYFEKSFNLSPEYFNRDKSIIESIYVKFIEYFYNQKDRDNFIKTAKRLKSNNYKNTPLLDKIVDIVERNGVWPKIQFN